MSAEPVTRATDGAVATLLAPLLAATPGPSQWRLVGWDCEAGISLSLARGGSVLLVELEARDEARDCYARTARFNVCARRAFEASASLGDDERRAIDRLVELVRAREDLLPEVERQATSRRTAVRVVDVDRVLVEEGAGHYYVNPYVGCLIGCEFCYAAERADFSRSLEGLPKLAWGRWVDVKVDAPDVLRRELARHAPGIVRLSPIVTDPYQPLERKYRVTRRCLEALLEAGFTPVVLTRSALVLEDLELLSRFPRAAVGLSVPTDDDAVRQRFEPGGDPIDERLEALARCHEAGLRTFAVVQPMLPMNATHLVERLAPYVHAVRVDRMYELARVRHLYESAEMLEAMTDAFFERTAAELRAAFSARGVVYDAMDDLGSVLGLHETSDTPREVGSTRLPSRLSQVYDRLYAASARGEANDAYAAFMQLAGLTPRREVRVVPNRPPPRTVSVVRYDEPRSIDFVALESGARDTAKVEDLDLRAAEAVEARLRGAGLDVVRSTPYRKRFDVPESNDVSGAELYNLYVSRSGKARELAEAERDRTPNGTRRAGLALGYPSCCVERFVSLERSAATYDDGLNEVALRAFVGRGVVPWELNPLSTLAPVCFTPCSASCPAALAVARKILGALRDADSRSYDETREALLRPVLFLRFPLFWVLHGAEVSGTTVRYADALPNDDRTGAPAALAAWAHDEIGSALAQGDELGLEAGTLQVRAGGRPIARWAVPSPAVARLLRFVETA